MLGGGVQTQSITEGMSCPFFEVLPTRSTHSMNSLRRVQVRSDVAHRYRESDRRQVPLLSDAARPRFATPSASRPSSRSTWVAGAARSVHPLHLVRHHPSPDRRHSWTVLNRSPSSTPKAPFAPTASAPSLIGSDSTPTPSWTTSSSAGPPTASTVGVPCLLLRYMRRDFRG